MNIKKLIAEAVATAVLIFAGAGAVLANASGGHLGTVGIAFAHGLAILVMVYAIGHISGAHINPAVTIALWATKRMKTPDAVAYIIAQLVGASVAALALTLIFPNAIGSMHVGAPTLASFVGIRGGLLVEAILTGVLVFTVFGVTDKRAPAGIGGVAIGLAVLLGLLVGGPLTGAALNPARSFGPALISQFWTNHWIYWVGPVVGGLFGAFLYKAIAEEKT